MGDIAGEFVDEERHEIQMRRALGAIGADTVAHNRRPGRASRQSKAEAMIEEPGDDGMSEMEFVATLNRRAAVYRDRLSTAQAASRAEVQMDQMHDATTSSKSTNFFRSGVAFNRGMGQGGGPKRPSGIEEVGGGEIDVVTGRSTGGEPAARRPTSGHALLVMQTVTTTKRTKKGGAGATHPTSANGAPIEDVEPIPKKFVDLQVMIGQRAPKSANGPPGDGPATVRAAGARGGDADDAVAYYTSPECSDAEEHDVQAEEYARDYGKQMAASEQREEEEEDEMSDTELLYRMERDADQVFADIAKGAAATPAAAADQRRRKSRSYVRSECVLCKFDDDTTVFVESGAPSSLATIVASMRAVISSDRTAGIDVDSTARQCHLMYKHELWKPERRRGNLSLRMLRSHHIKEHIENHVVHARETFFEDALYNNAMLIKSLYSRLWWSPSGTAEDAELHPSHFLVLKRSMETQMNLVKTMNATAKKNGGASGLENDEARIRRLQRFRVQGAAQRGAPAARRSGAKQQHLQQASSVDDGGMGAQWALSAAERARRQMAGKHKASKT